MSRRSRVTLLIGVEGKADEKFVKSVLLPRLRVTAPYDRLSIDCKPAHGDGQSILNRISQIHHRYDYCFLFVDQDRWGAAQQKQANDLKLDEKCVISLPCLEGLLLELTGSLPHTPLSNAGHAKAHFRQYIGKEAHEVSYKNDLSITNERLDACESLKPWHKLAATITRSI